MEAVKDRFTCILRNARALVVDSYPDLVADSRSGNFDQPARRREADRVVENIVDRARQPVWLAHHGRGVHARAGEGNAGAVGLTASLPARDKLLDHRAEIDPV